MCDTSAEATAKDKIQQNLIKSQTVEWSGNYMGFSPKKNRTDLNVY